MFSCKSGIRGKDCCDYHSEDDRNNMENEKELYTTSSTMGVCSCGGMIDFNKKAEETKPVFRIGKYIVQKYVRTLYFCHKCKQYK